MKNKTRRDFLKKSLIGASAIALASAPAMGRGRRGGRNTATASMTDDQKSTLLFMYQEEKVARDVYNTLGRKYPSENTFANIQLSEQKHVDAVEILCNKYGVDISDVNEDIVGEFVLPELQDLYDECVEKGSESLLDGLYVGEDIEIKDITDLEEAAVGMPSDVVQVFMNLRDGSINHLSAFRNAIARELR